MKNQHHTLLTAKERDLLSVWKAKGLSNKECARRLKRPASTVGREIKRNGFRENGHWYYSAIYAHSQFNQRQKRVAHSKRPLKNSLVFAYVTKHLRDGWSPDQIAGRLRVGYPFDPRMRIVAETIYRWIYQEDQLVKGWYEYLRRKQKRRRIRSGRRVHRANIRDRVSIDQRPEKINQRLEFGHWEGDTVEGRGHREGLHTEVERISRFILADRVNAINGRQTIRVQRQLFELLPREARLSTTLDNGRENHHHQRLWSLGMQTFFAHPYSAFERGTN